MNRACPNCGKQTVPVWKLMFWRVRCPACGADVSTAPAWRMAILSVEMIIWMLALVWLYRDYGRAGLVASLLIWLSVDFIADCFAPLVVRPGTARDRPP